MGRCERTVKAGSGAVSVVLLPECVQEVVVVVLLGWEVPERQEAQPPSFTYLVGLPPSRALGKASGDTSWRDGVGVVCKCGCHGACVGEMAWRGRSPLGPKLPGLDAVRTVWLLCVPCTASNSRRQLLQAETALRTGFLSFRHSTSIFF